MVLGRNSPNGKRVASAHVRINKVNVVQRNVARNKNQHLGEIEENESTFEKGDREEVKSFDSDNMSRTIERHETNHDEILSTAISKNGLQVHIETDPDSRNHDSVRKNRSEELPTLKFQKFKPKVTSLVSKRA